MTLLSGSDSGRQLKLLALLAPSAAVLLAWTVLSGASSEIRAGLVVALVSSLALLALRMPGRRLWVSYGAAAVAILLPLLVALSVQLPREALALQGLGILGVTAVALFFVSNVRDEARRTQRLEELKSSFVALANHELRTPVAVLHGTLDTLVDDLHDTLTPQQEAFLLAARSSSGALAYLVEMMTQFHELETSPPSAQSPGTPLGSLVHATALDLRALFEQYGVELEIRLAPEAALSMVPRSYVHIILEQLLRNAAKFNHPGGHAAVKAHVEGRDLVVSVRDDGSGISAADHDVIFESFYQNGELLSRSTSGLGLGLALARLAADRMHGSIEVDSAPGKGSTFVVRLPHTLGALHGAA